MKVQGTFELLKQMIVGNGTDSYDKKVAEVNNGASNKPYIGYNETDDRFILADDGVNEKKILTDVVDGGTF